MISHLHCTHMYVAFSSAVRTDAIDPGLHRIRVTALRLQILLG